MLNSFVTSGIRTAVPYAVAFLVSTLISIGVDVPPSVAVWLTNALTFILGTAYYLAARWLERKNPKLGWLLGVPSQPVYKK